jgi:hypothetical protein
MEDEEVLMSVFLLGEETNVSQAYQKIIDEKKRIEKSQQ